MTTVMVVEDDPAFLTRFCKIVACGLELEVFAAVTDLASARLAMSKAAPDVLLTDLGLPDGSGIDLIRETAHRYPTACNVDRRQAPTPIHDETPGSRT